MESDQLSFLSISVSRPRVAFFEFTSCEGCQLQLLNDEETLIPFLSLLDIRAFREAMTDHSEDYDIAFIEGSVGRRDDISRLHKIRKQARLVVALGSCACFGGVNQIVNNFGPEAAKKIIYGKHSVPAVRAKPVNRYVAVDFEIFGCPIRKSDVEKLIVSLALGKSFSHPKYPVCIECKAHENICLFDLGEPCIGPITRGGCEAWCPGNHAGCRGCRGAVDDANVPEMIAILRQHGFSDETICDRLGCFGGFGEYQTLVKRSRSIKKGRQK